MVILWIFLLLGLLVFLYTLYRLGKDDYLLARRNVSLENLFNMTFFLLFVSTFFARLFYVVFHWQKRFINPLVFLAIPYYPGLMVLGGIVGAMLFLWFLTSVRKLPGFRLFDIYAFAFITALPLGYMGIYLNDMRHTPILYLLWPLVFLVFAIALNKTIVPKMQLTDFHDGTLGCIAIAGFACFSLLLEILLQVIARSHAIHWDMLVLFLLLVAAAGGGFLIDRGKLRPKK